jgi:peroxiredoxin
MTAPNTRTSTGRRLVTYALLALFLLPVLALSADKTVEPGDTAPDFTLADAKGARHTLSKYRDKAIVLLDFGRFTCKPCIETAKMLEGLHKRYADKGVRIFQVNLDGPLADRVVPQAIKDLEITFGVLLDTDYAVAKRYGVETIPFLVLVDLKGKVQFTHVGYSEDLKEKLSELFDKHRPKKKKPQAH